MMWQQWLNRALISLVLFPTGTAHANPVQSEHIEVALLSEVTSVQPGKAFWVGLHLRPNPNWKTYWRNPGNSGRATVIDWRLPQGASTSPIHWPHPERFSVQDIVSYGYTGEVLLLTRIQPGASLKSGTDPALEATAFWLVCDHSCIPGTAKLTLNLTVSNTPPTVDPRWVATFAAARDRLPVDVAHWRAGFDLKENVLQLQVETPTPYSPRPSRSNSSRARGIWSRTTLHNKRNGNRHACG